MNATWLYAIAGMIAVSTLFGAIRLFGSRPKREAHAAVTNRGRAGQGLKSASEEDEESQVEVVSRTSVGFGGSLVLVRFEGRRILLGVTRGQWTALVDLGRTAAQKNKDTLSVIDAELNRALHADRIRRGRKGS